MKKYENPKEGIYVSSSGEKIFILTKQDGPYPLDDGQEVSLYTFIDEKGTFPKTTILYPFKAIYLGPWEENV
jgi:hypothetical protein